jgi:hypothetical protein
MVAKATWLTIEPEISLEGYLASEEIDLFQPPLAWMPDEWSVNSGQDEVCESHERRT